jgi:hypothetical protein
VLLLFYADKADKMLYKILHIFLPWVRKDFMYFFGYNSAYRPNISFKIPD